MEVNYLQILQAIKNGQNPQQLIMNILEGQMSQTPMGQNLLELAKQHDTKAIEQIARNICKQQGVDFDKEFMSFRKQIGY